MIAEIAAYSFGGIDALLVGGWGDPGPLSLAAGEALLQPIAKCAAGGESKRPGEPGGYASAFEGAERALLFHNADEAVIHAYAARHERDPCDATIATAPVIDTILLSRVQVPVFLFYGLNDALWPVGTGTRQRMRFTGSRDVTLLELPDTGHLMMLERTNPILADRMSDWMQMRGF